MQTDESLDFVAVGMYWNEMHAWIVHNLLREEGLDAYVFDAGVVTTYWFYANAIGGVRVVVPRRQVAQAEAILAEDRSHLLPYSPRTARPTDVPTCAACGSPDVHPERWSRRAIYFWLLLLGLLLPIRSNATECYDCGHREGPPRYFLSQTPLDLVLLMLAAAVAFLFAVVALIVLMDSWLDFIYTVIYHLRRIY